MRGTVYRVAVCWALPETVHEPHATAAAPVELRGLARREPPVTEEKPREILEDLSHHEREQLASNDACEEVERGAREDEERRVADEEEAAAVPAPTPLSKQLPVAHWSSAVHVAPPSTEPTERVQAGTSSSSSFTRLQVEAPNAAQVESLPQRGWHAATGIGQLQCGSQVLWLFKRR